MDVLGPAFLSLALAFTIALVELVTSKYPRTFCFCRRSPALYGYSLIYGAIGFGEVWGLDALLDAQHLELEGYGIDNRWVQGVVIGLSVKALLHIRLFNVSTGIGATQSFPIGLETLVQLFEPWLLRGIELDHFNNTRKYLQPRVEKYADLRDVKQKIKDNLPKTFSSHETLAVQADIDGADTIMEAMELYVNVAGRGSVNRVFPL